VSFYAGDIVICVETNKYYYFQKGEIYTVTAFQGRITDPNWATIKPHTEKTAEWCINVPIIQRYFKKLPTIGRTRINHTLP
jgi:hypothetical protein